MIPPSAVRLLAAEAQELPMKIFTPTRALLGGLLLAVQWPALASEPASHEVTVPTQDGETVVVEWTGTALPGTSGSGSLCPPQGPDDFHDIILSVPEGTYDAVTVTASFHIEWEPGSPDPSGSFTDPDLVLSVVRGLISEGDSDGGSPEENVTLTNPEAGTLRAIACPFAASDATPYSGRLTLTAVGGAACLNLDEVAKSHAAPGTGSAVTRDPEARGWLNLDRFQQETRSRDFAPQGRYPGRHQAPLFDRQLGLPTMLWARKDAAALGAAPLQDEQERLAELARAHLRSEAKLLKLSPAMIREAKISDAQYNGAGPAVVRLRQQVNGLEVFHRSLNVLIDRNDRPAAVSGYFATDYDAQSVAARAFILDAPQAIAAAWGSLGGVLDPLTLTADRLQGDYTWFDAPALSGSHLFERQPRARAVYYPRAGTLEPAWHLELFARERSSGQLSAYGFVVSAVDGQLLHRKNLVAEAAFSYRVFADDSGDVQPYDSPLGNGYAPFTGDSPTATIERIGASTRIVTLEAGPISTGDPWLTDGATETSGNNVDACLDAVDAPSVGFSISVINTCDPELGDFRAATTGPNSFDYALEADSDPSETEAQNAAIVNLFYMNNWLHDWWYDHGFNEAAGNAQVDNYGRGGVGGDPIKAQGQDASGRNNANMATPGDGSSPTMQQYLFDGAVAGVVRQLAPIDGEPLVFNTASFGPTEFDVTGEVELAADAFGEPTDGCGQEIDPAAPTAPATPQASLQGKIALIHRGGCNFTSKAQFALSSGAIAMVVVNNADGEPISMGNGDIPINAGASPTDAAYQIPSVMIRKADGLAIQAQLADSTVSMHVQRLPSIDYDGTLDNQIIAHEFYHYVHHRLTDSSNNQARAMSEGWGDIGGFMFTARPEDALIAGNDRFQGAYSLASYVSNNFFAGIRRAPYSTDFKLNAFTLRHIGNGEPTPDGAAGDNNSQVHNSGEIWANQMWECYAGLLNSGRYGFAEAQQRMKDLIIGGLKMTPADATYTEARDAVLAVALATDPLDYAVCSAGFAKRGNGLFAVAPARASEDHVGWWKTSRRSCAARRRWWTPRPRPRPVAAPRRWTISASAAVPCRAPCG